MDNIELENKFNVEEERLERLLELALISEFAGFTREDVYRIKLHHEYFDTKSYTLARNHASYRHSHIEGDDKFRITFKKEETPGDLSKRLELKAFVQNGSYIIGPVSCDYLESNLAPVVIARGITGSEKRVWLAMTIINKRTAVKFIRNGVVLEIGIDNVSYVSPDFKIKNDYELEVEMIEGNDIDALNDFSNGIAIKYDLKPNIDNKYIRGLKLHNLL